MNIKQMDEQLRALLDEKLEITVEKETELHLDRDHRDNDDMPPSTMTIKFIFDGVTLKEGLVNHAVKDLMVNWQNRERPKFRKRFEGDVEAFYEATHGQTFTYKVGAPPAASGMSDEEKELMNKLPSDLVEAVRSGDMTAGEAMSEFVKRVREGNYEG